MLICNRLQRYPDREAHGLATEDKAGTETQGDTNAMLYYHKIGTSQGVFKAIRSRYNNPDYMKS
jgi:prolyl oligopeptidase